MRVADLDAARDAGWDEAHRRELVIRPLSTSDELDAAAAASAMATIGIDRSRLFALIRQYRAAPEVATLLSADLNTIRYLANDLRMPLVCTGNHEARAALLTDAALADRFDAVELVRWRDDEQFRLLMVTLAAILPLRKPSQLAEDGFRDRVLELTDGNTGRIFRLIETLAVGAIRNGRETISLADLDADDLVLPTVSMKAIASRTGKHAAGAVRAV